MCTRILRNSDDHGPVLTGRTMDWPMSTQALITVFPAGRRRRGGMAGEQEVISDNPLEWTSKYGSIVTGIYGIGSADGINEPGLAAHLLYLKATDTGPGGSGKPALQIALWAQYVLDNAATVEEALTLLDSVEIVKTDVDVKDEDGETHTVAGTLHLAMEDARGDSAIVEFIEGRPTVHYGREYTVMTNDPSYREQLDLLKGQEEALKDENGNIVPSRDLPLPGNVAPVDRFQRATYFSRLLPKTDPAKPQDEQYRKAVAGMLSITRNVSVPAGAPYSGEFATYDTEYRTICDLSNKRYFFELSTSPSLIWTEIDSHIFESDDPDGPVKALDPYTLGLETVGDVTDRFKPVKVGF